MQWQERFELGIPQIDGQHQEWIRRIDTLKDALNTRRMYQELGQTLKFIVGYTHFHFETEETILKENGYADLAHHKQLHADLTGQVTHILSNLKHGKHLFPTQIIDFLNNWAIEHILNEDKKYSHFLEGKKEKEIDPVQFNGGKRQQETRGALVRLADLHKQGTLDQKNYAEEKEHLLCAFTRLEPSADRQQIKGVMDHLEKFCQETLITSEESEKHRSGLFKSHLLVLELERRKRPETKLNYLTAAKEGNLLTLEEYEAHREAVLGKKA